MPFKRTTLASQRAMHFAETLEPTEGMVHSPTSNQWELGQPLQTRASAARNKRQLSGSDFDPIGELLAELRSRGWSSSEPPEEFLPLDGKTAWTTGEWEFEDWCQNHVSIFKCSGVEQDEAEAGEEDDEVEPTAKRGKGSSKALDQALTRFFGVPTTSVMTRGSSGQSSGSSTEGTVTAVPSTGHSLGQSSDMVTGDGVTDAQAPGSVPGVPGKVRSPLTQLIADAFGEGEV